MAMLLIILLHVAVIKATVKSGEVYLFGVVLMWVAKLFFALGFVYALALHHVANAAPQPKVHRHCANLNGDEFEGLDGE